MPVDSVSLREITSIQGNPENAYGSTPGGTNAVIPFGQSIPFLNQAARLKAEADQFKYLQFQENLKNFYKDFNTIDVKGIMEVDYPEINNEYATLAKDLAENYDVIRNPVKNPEKYAELKEREAKLRGNIERSKQDLAWRDAHKVFMTANPSFNTPENKSEFDKFNNSPLGSRQYSRLNTPFVYNPTQRAKAAMDVAQQKLKTEQLAGRYIETTESETYIQDEYLKAWKALGAQQDGSGRVMDEAAKDAYTKLGLLQDPAQFEAVDSRIALDLLNQNKVTTTRREDPVQAQEDAQAFQGRQAAAERAMRWKIANLKDDDKTVRTAGRLYNQALTSFATNGYVNSEVATSVWGDLSDVEMTTKEMTTDANGFQVETGKTITTKVPKVIVTGMTRNADGSVTIERYDNEKKAKLPDLKRTYDEARVDLTNILGSKNAGRVADAASQDRKDNNWGEFSPDIPKMQEAFKFNPEGRSAQQKLEGQASGEAGTDETLSEGEYYKKYKKAKPKK